MRRIGPSAPFLLVCGLLTGAEAAPRFPHHLQLSGNWSSYGNGNQGIGYGLRYARSMRLGDRLALQAGLQASFIPSVNVLEFIGDQYGEKFYGTTYHVYEESRVYYAGVPADLRYTFTSSAIRPYIVFANRLDVKVFQTVEETDAFPICRPVRTAECLDRPEFREASFHPIVLKSALLLGIRHQRPSLSPSLELGIQLDVSPSRERTKGERSRIPAVVSTFGLEF